jgi:hypothetical protein
MDIHKIIAELRQELSGIEQLITTIEGLEPAEGHRKVRQTFPVRGGRGTPKGTTRHGASQKSGTRHASGTRQKARSRRRAASENVPE